jgi:hypothetical protein
VQVGEPVSVAPPMPPLDEVRFAAELVSVSFKSSLKTSYAQAAISSPHWEAGKDSEVRDDWKDMAKKVGVAAAQFSKRAAVYLVKGGTGGVYDVEVKVKVTQSENVSGDAKLIGNLGGLTIEGTCPTGAGDHVVTARFIEPPDEMRAFRGKMGWGLDVPSYGRSVNLGTSIAEVYFILGAPTTPYASAGVWSEVLRFLFGRVGVGGLKDGPSVRAQVARYCHGLHKLQYDTVQGAPKYGTWPGGGVFELTEYMQRSDELCNCYDQASAVQVLVGALGVDVVWLYLKPYGYINETNLVGVGACNNPFFTSNGTKKVVAWDDPQRTAFGNHAFPGTAPTTSANIVDACAGPHTGSETLPQYIVAAIDHRASLYPSGSAPGAVGNIVLCPNVSAVV